MGQEPRGCWGCQVWPRSCRLADVPVAMIESAYDGLVEACGSQTAGFYTLKISDKVLVAAKGGNAPLCAESFALKAQSDCRSSMLRPEACSTWRKGS